MCAHCAHASLGSSSIYIFIICLCAGVCVCVCVCFCVSAFMPCINVTMHHLCHLLSAHKCKIRVLLTQRLCPNRRATPFGLVTLLPRLSTFCLCPQHTTHTHKLPHTRVYRNRIALPKLRLCLCLGQLFLCCQCWLMNFYSRPADAILIHLAGQKRP